MNTDAVLMVALMLLIVVGVPTVAVRVPERWLGTFYGAIIGTVAGGLLVAALLRVLW